MHFGCCKGFDTPLGFLKGWALPKFGSGIGAAGMGAALREAPRKLGRNVLASGRSPDTKVVFKKFKLANLRASPKFLASVLQVSGALTAYITYDAMQNGKKRTFASNWCDCKELLAGHSFNT